MNFNHPLDALKYHVSGVIERGEGEAITEIRHVPVTIKTYSLEDGKYEVDRDSETGLMVTMRRNGETWYEGMELLRFMKVFHAALNRIDELEVKS